MVREVSRREERLLAVVGTSNEREWTLGGTQRERGISGNNGRLIGSNSFPPSLLFSLSLPSKQSLGGIEIRKTLQQSSVGCLSHSLWSVRL